jgi:hypothetical protein
MLTHVIKRFSSNNFVEDYSCAMCEESYPSIVQQNLERFWDKPKRLYRESLKMMEDGYARYVDPLVSRLEAIEGYAAWTQELREKVRHQLSRPRPESANAKWN